MMSSRNTAASRRTNRLAENALAQPGLDRALQDEIDLPSKQLLEKLFQVHVAVEGLLRKLDQEVDVALRPGLSTRMRSKKRELDDTERGETRAICINHIKDIVAGHP